jgi:hypothetical protein
MYRNNSNGSRAALAWKFMALVAIMPLAALGRHRAGRPCRRHNLHWVDFQRDD